MMDDFHMKMLQKQTRFNLIIASTSFIIALLGIYHMIITQKIDIPNEIIYIGIGLLGMASLLASYEIVREFFS